MDACLHPFLSKVEDWHWWYRTRREILDVLLDGLGLDPARTRILDVGCGTGGMSLVLSRYGQVVGLDAEQCSFALSLDRPYAHRVVGTAEVLPFADESFDVVCAFDVLEHLDDDVRCAREIRRVLKPGGTAIVFVPAFHVLWGRNDEMAQHRRRYNREMLQRSIEAAGLSVSAIGYFNMVLFLPVLAARLAERVLPGAIGKLEYEEKRTPLNEILARVFRLELPLIRRTPLPVGTSAFCLAHK